MDEFGDFDDEMFTESRERKTQLQSYNLKHQEPCVSEPCHAKTCLYTHFLIVMPHEGWTVPFDMDFRIWLCCFNVIVRQVLTSLQMRDMQLIYVFGKTTCIQTDEFL